MADQRLNRLLAAGLGSGWLPKAPGTWGSLASLLPGWLIGDLFGVSALLIASGGLFALGCALCARLLPTLPDKDPGWIVIDEWAGQWLALAMLMPLFDDVWLLLVTAFIAFRLCDIVKPWPVSLSERLGPPWWSIMADDMVAGLMGGMGVIGLMLLLQGGV